MTKKLLPKDLPKYFCFKPWNEVYSHFNTIGPCCVNYNFYDGSFDSYLQSEELKSLRKEFLIGGKPTSCSACWKAEDAKINSVRQLDKNFSKNLNRISISLSNKCNFKCMMCNPEDSSAWANDPKACSIRGMASTYSNPQFGKIDWIRSQAKKQKITLTVMGGEPFICDEYLYLLNLIEQNNLYESIYLVMTTNLSVLSYKGVDHIDHLKRFKDVDVYASFDGVGAVGEYIRTGFSAKKFQHNLEACLDLVNYFSTTIQIYNIFNLPKIFEYAESYGISVNYNFLVDPEFLSVYVLEKVDRKRVLDYYDSVNFFNPIADCLKQEIFIPKKQQFLNYTTQLDSLWNRNFSVAIPELKQIL